MIKFVIANFETAFFARFCLQTPLLEQKIVKSVVISWYLIHLCDESDCCSWKKSDYENYTKFRSGKFAYKKMMYMKASRMDYTINQDG